MFALFVIVCKSPFVYSVMQLFSYSAIHLHVSLIRKSFKSKVLLYFSKSLEGLALNFKTYNVYICVCIFKTRMSFVLAALQEFNICCLLRYLIMSTVHGFFTHH